ALVEGRAGRKKRDAATGTGSRRALAVREERRKGGGARVAIFGRREWWSDGGLEWWRVGYRLQVESCRFGRSQFPLTPALSVRAGLAIRRGRIEVSAARGWRFR